MEQYEQFGTLQSPKKKNLPEKVSRYIRKQILSGYLTAGTHLNEGAIAEEIGVSRSPVREAIKILENEGIIETLPTGRTIVLGFTLMDLKNLYELRFDLEWKAIQPLHEKGMLSFVQIGEMERILNRMKREETSIEEFELLDTLFHRKLVEASKNRPLIRTWKTLIQTILTLQEITNEHKDKQFLVNLGGNHREIFDSIKQGDNENTRQLLSKHCQDGLDIVSRVLEENITRLMSNREDQAFLYGQWE
jgi:DNA-binding GntR family transcriptional regulator